MNNVRDIFVWVHEDRNRHFLCSFVTRSLKEPVFVLAIVVVNLSNNDDIGRYNSGFSPPKNCAAN